jgi:hypothetical protein
MYKIREYINKAFEPKNLSDRLILCFKVSLLTYSPFITISVICWSIIYGFGITEENNYYVILSSCGKSWIGGIITILPFTLAYLLLIFTKKI